ncbi:hypothetical protein M9H77_11092 [Catharanthus roseus]|uniref:Uncharacterized protein n=1 Tax=Catharanthus roseus TaxID=4058 RepID=A0ACC0BDN2_CATRO|nr:hypothetical protein M9H77_11092 [Catharanthus roseus]
MAEEFQESEVVFEQNAGIEENEEYNFPVKFNSGELIRNSKPKRKKLRRKKNSVPMSIPENFSNSSWIHCVDSDFFDDDDEIDGDDGEIVPPHVIIGRRIAGKMMSFSVCTGNGRTLKGRDLSEVRNSILRMTGFLET